MPHLGKKKEIIRELAFRSGLPLQEILRTAFGSKPSLLFSLDKNDAKIIKKLFPWLTILSGGLFLNPVRKHNLLPNYAIAKNLKLAKELLTTQAQEDSEKNGRLLGYPKCCINNLLNCFDRDYKPWSKELIYQSYKKTERYSFFLNNIFNFNSRLGDDKKHFDALRQYLFINSQFYPPVLQLQFISHIPCSYDCPQSLLIGQESYQLLKMFYPRLALKIKFILENPVLFFDIFKWVIFAGAKIKRGNLLRYKKVIEPTSLIENDLIETIKLGNKIKLVGNSVAIFRNNGLVNRYIKDGKGFILNFS